MSRQLAKEETDGIEALLNLKEVPSPPLQTSPKNNFNELELQQNIKKNPWEQFVKQQQSWKRNSSHIAISYFILYQSRLQVMEQDETYSAYAKEFLLPLLDPTIDARKMKESAIKANSDIVIPKAISCKKGN